MVSHLCANRYDILAQKVKDFLEDFDEPIERPVDVDSLIAFITGRFIAQWHRQHMKSVHYTQSGVLTLLRREIARLGGQQQDFARLHGISTAYICDVLKRRREPGAKILDALYLVKEVRYVPKIQKRGKS